MSAWTTFRLVIALVVLSELDTAIFYPILPELVETYGVTAQAMQLPAFAMLFIFGIGLAFWAPLVAFLGRRPAALMGLAIFTIGSLVTAYAPIYEAFLAGRLIQGFALSCAGVISPVVPTDLFEGESLRRAFAQISMAFSITPMLAQVLGGYLSQHYHHERVFLGFAVAGVCLLVLFYRSFPETRARANTPPFVFLPWLKEHLVIGRNPLFLRNVVCLWLIFAGESLFVTMMHFALQLDLGISAHITGWLGAVASMGLLVGAFTSFKLSHYLAIEPTIRLGLGGCLLGSTLLVIGQFLEQTGPLLWMAPMFVYLVGAGLVYPNAINAIMKHFSQHSTQAAALFSFLQMAGAGALNLVITQGVAPSAQVMGMLIFLIPALALGVTYWAQSETA